MRAKKDVLVVGDSELMASVRLTLKLGSRFRVWEAATAGEAELALKKWPFYLVIAYAQTKGIGAVISDSSRTPVLLINRRWTIAAINDEVLRLTTRKRGPRTRRNDGD